VLIGALVEAAEAHLDGYAGVLGRALVTQSWRVNAAAFADPFRLPLGDMISVTSVKYFDGSNVQQTLATTVYGAYTDALSPYLALKYGQTWPTVYTRPDAIEVNWSAGYGPKATDVPEALRHAARLMVGHLYRNREATTTDALAELPLGVALLIEPYRLNRI